MNGLINLKYIVIIILISLSVNCKSQVPFFRKDSLSIYRNELGMDVAYFLTFLQRNSQSYLINYKYYFLNENALRGGLNLDISSFKEKATYLDTRLGYELGKQLNKWRLFYGSDLSIFYSKGRLQPNQNYRIGFEPLIGGKYFFSKNFSISSELKVNFYYYIYRNKESFDPNANNEDMQISVGSLGMILLNFHF